jgi:FkbM family methyltransferase
MGLSRKLKILVSSRKLFKNWLSASVKYYLIKYGLVKGNVIIVKCRNKNYVLSPEVYSSIITAYHYRAFEELECHDALYAVLTYGCKKLRFYDSFEFLYDIVFENFIGGAYDDLDVRDKTVVDIGAGVGDTAILFSLRGAKRVIALEPFPDLYKKALINIRINSFKNRILLINAGLGSFDGEVTTKSNNVHGYYLFRPKTGNVNIRIYTLSSLIKEYKIEKDSVLKMDCEGCEYETIPNVRSDDLATFKQIIIEYHDGYVKLKRILEDVGFETKIKPIKSRYQPLEKQGYIVATRKN